MIGAYLQSVHDLLKRRIGVESAFIGIRLQGRPIPNCPSLYFAIHPLAVNGTGTETYFEYTIGIGVTITVRNGNVPDDRMAAMAFLGEKGLDSYAERVVSIMETNKYQLLEDTNNNIKADNKFIEPLQWTGTEIPPRPVGPEWFNETPTRNPSVLDFGLAMQLSFTGARRLQDITQLKP